MTKLILRRNNYENFWITTHSIETGFVSKHSCKWSNTLYLHFCKDDFPNLKYPKHEEGRFNYMDEHDLHQIPFHKGITFYEETKNLESGKTYVKVGCDYQHLYDNETYGRDDCGEDIIKTDGNIIAEAFLKMIDEATK